MILFDQIKIPEDPWKKIGIAANNESIKSRRVDPDFHHNVFWTRNHNGEIGFRLSSKTKLDFSKNLPRISGIEITINKSDQGHFWLDLSLVKKKSDDLFRTISIDLLQLLFSIEKGRDDEAAKAIIDRLMKWQKLLKSKGGDDYLGPEQQLGLFGELLILRDFFLNKLSPINAFTAWIGPKDSPQDFKHLDLLLEIKTNSASSNRPIKISSLEQLNSRGLKLYLIHQLISEDRTEGITLQELVNSIRDEYASANLNAGVLFKVALLSVGFEDDEMYNHARWKLHSRKSYQVVEGFPMLTDENVHPSISKATYIIEIESCNEYIVEKREIEEEIKGEKNGRN
jgi:hypothetical protein